MRRKLAASLFGLHEKGLLPKLFHVVGFSKQALTTEGFREMVRDMIGAKERAQKEKVEQFVTYFFYQQGLFEQLEGYRKVANILGMRDNEWRVCSNKLFYIAASPQFYKTIFVNLDKSRLTEPCSPEEGWTRVLVEKPFGKDLKTAQDLDRLLGKLFQEEQIYRIDHYLGKETVQNILAFRFSNSFLQDSWNKEGIKSIHIELFEKEGIKKRGGFYDGIGALRDVGQNHILQLLALFTMENPGTFDAKAIRKKRAEVLQALKIYRPREIAKMTMRGQYKGYTKEKDVDPKSRTETYFLMKAYLGVPRWEGIPISMGSGKAMAEDRVEVRIRFRHPTPCLCPLRAEKHYRNVLHYRIQPNEGIDIMFWAKKPGPEMILEEKSFSFDYKKAFGEDSFADAYEKLLVSAFQGDQTLFVSTEEIVASWKFIDPILRAWQKNIVPLKRYKSNSAEIIKVPLPIDE